MNLAYLEVDHQRAVYTSMRPMKREAFWERLVLSWLYHDHALEGVVVTQQDLARALDGLPCRSYCDARVQGSLLRLKAAIAYIEESAARGDDLTMEWVKDLHARLCPEGDEGAGRYRKRGTSPGVYNLDVVAPASISYHFRKFFDLLDGELESLHPLRKAAIAHWEFMKVFPFDERTGVVGRLMMNFILLKHKYPPGIIHAMDRHHYFGALSGHRTDLVPVLVEAVSATIEAARNFDVPRAMVEHQLAL
jgi:Fic family protein